MNSVTQKGITAVETLVAVSIAALVIIFSTHAIVYFVATGSDIAGKTQALYLAEEGLELVRFVRDDDWSNVGALTSGNTYYLNVSTTSVSVTGTPEIIDAFSRSFVVEEVSRNSSNDDIVPDGTPGSAVDPDTLFVTAYISWEGSTTSLSTYLMNIHD